MNFKQDFDTFLAGGGFTFENRGNTYLFGGCNLRIVLVPLAEGAGFSPDGTTGTIYLFEDRWFTSKDLIMKRISARLGDSCSIFARNCTVRRIDSATADAFLAENHSYGAAKARYKYGMFELGCLVAVATFSSPRSIPRNFTDGTSATLKSYEWVRYASLADSTVSGGMGKMMAAFADEVQPDEIMSYADLEWSSGDVYPTLGFVEAGRRDPISFWVDSASYKRNRVPPGVEIRNAGSVKYLRNFLGKEYLF